MKRGGSKVEIVRCEGIEYSTLDESFELSCPSLRVERGEVVGLVGLNGVGKSTLLKLLLPDQGDLDGEFRAKQFEVEAKSRYFPAGGDGSFSGPVLVADYYTLLHSLHIGKHLPLLSRAARLERVLGVLGDTTTREHFVEIAWKLVTDMSSGERQRLLLAELLLCREPLLLLDEVAVHFDMAFERDLWRVLRERSAALRGACLVVSHHIPVVRTHADRAYLVRSETEKGKRRSVVIDAVIPGQDDELLNWMVKG